MGRRGKNGCAGGWPNQGKSQYLTRASVWGKFFPRMHTDEHGWSSKLRPYGRLPIATPDAQSDICIELVEKHKNQGIGISVYMVGQATDPIQRPHNGGSATARTGSKLRPYGRLPLATPDAQSDICIELSEKHNNQGIGISVYMVGPATDPTQRPHNGGSATARTSSILPHLCNF